MPNVETQMTLEDAVGEVLNILTGLDLDYNPQYDRFRVITKALNRAQRANALEKEWSYYVSVKSLGLAVAGERQFILPDNDRPRVINDDQVRFCDPTDGAPLYWAAFIPRDAIHKYAHRRNMKCAVTRNLVQFSRPFSIEAGLDVQLPIMREPVNIRLPEDPEVAPAPEVLGQLIDFDYPDVIIARAAYMMALTDPVVQPRAQTLEAAYKDLMYQAIERDDRFTDSPFQNEFFVPVQNTIFPESRYRPFPLADDRR